MGDVNENCERPLNLSRRNFIGALGIASLTACGGGSGGSSTADPVATVDPGTSSQSAQPLPPPSAPSTSAPPTPAPEPPPAPAPAPPQAPQVVATLRPDDTRLLVSDFTEIAERSSSRLRFRRPLDDGQGANAASPGARVGVRTDAQIVEIEVAYNGRYTREPRSSAATVLVDGVVTGTFLPDGGPTTRKRLDLQSRQARTIELLWPYADGLDLISIGLSEAGLIAQATPRPARTVILFGDSITQGYSASSVEKSWPLIMANVLPCHVVNMGYGGRICVPTDGTLAGHIATPYGASATVVCTIGVNDTLGGIHPQVFKGNLKAFAEAFLTTASRQRLVFTSPFFSPRVEQEGYRLDAMRDAMQHAVHEIGSSFVLFNDGRHLCAHTADRFDSDGVHPSDLGHAEIGRGMASALRSLLG